MPKQLKQSVMSGAKTITSIPLDQIEFDKSQAQNIRRIADTGSIVELALSIEQHGLQNPIQVYLLESGHYQIISGHRRYLAHKDLLEEDKPTFGSIEAIIAPKPADRASLTAAQLIENIQREDLPPADIERALTYYLKETGLKPEQAGKQLGKSAAWIYKYIKAADTRQQLREQLPEQSQEIEQLHTSTAAAIGSAKTPEARAEAYTQTQAAGGTTQAAEKIARKPRPKKTPVPGPLQLPPNPQVPSDPNSNEWQRPARARSSEPAIITMPADPETELLALPFPCTPRAITDKIKKICEWHKEQKRHIKVGIEKKTPPMSFTIHQVLNAWLNQNSQANSLNISPGFIINIGIYNGEIKGCHQPPDNLSSNLFSQEADPTDLIEDQQKMQELEQNLRYINSERRKMLKETLAPDPQRNPPEEKALAEIKARLLENPTQPEEEIF